MTAEKEKINCCGMELTKMAEVGDGIFLVAHPNGPAIATKDSLFTIAHHLRCVESHDLPVEAAIRAIQAYKELTWPLVKGEWIEKEGAP